MPPVSSRAVRRFAVLGLAAAGLAALAACDGATGGPDPSPPNAPGPRTLRAAAGDGQRVTAGAPAAPLEVVVRDAAGAAVPGASVRFSTTDPRAVLGDTTVGTDVGGAARARVWVAAGAAPGPLVVRAALADAAPSDSATTVARLTLTVAAGPDLRELRPAAAATGDTVLLRGSGFASGAANGAVAVWVGGVAVRAEAVGDTLLRVAVPACLPGGAPPAAVRVVVDGAASVERGLTVTPRAAGAPLPVWQPLVAAGAPLDGCLVLGGTPGDEYLVVPHFVGEGVPTPVSFALRVDGGGATVALAGAGAGRTAMRAEVHAGAHADGRRAGAAPDPRGDAQARFDALLRARDRAAPPPARARRSVAPASGAQLGTPLGTARAAAAAPPAVGSTRTFQVYNSLGAETFATVTARLRYAGDHLLVYQDEAGGFADDDLGQLAPLLDRTLYARDVAAFGPETDLDGNGRVLVVLTPQLNALTAGFACAGGTVAGYFSGHDLGDAAHSNRGEVFFGAVADPDGRWGCAQSAAAARAALPAVFVHEFQHLISYGQHVLARGGTAEAVWLDEGLSHYAESLVGDWYDARYPAPAGRTDPAQLFPDSAQGYLRANVLNAYDWLSFPGRASATAYHDVGSFEERGAAWLFVRWLSDRHGPDAVLRLVQSARSGVRNVEAATGVPFGALYGQFALAAYLDAVPPAAGGPARPAALRLQQQRDMGAVFAALAARGAVGFAVPYGPPLVAAGSTVTGNMAQGALAPFRVRVGPSGVVTLRLGAAGGGAFAAGVAPQVAVVRLPR